MKKIIFSILTVTMVCSALHAAAPVSSSQALYDQLLSVKNMKKAADKKDMDQKQWAEFNDFVGQKMLATAEQLQASKTDTNPAGDSSIRKKLQKIIDLQAVALKKINETLESIK